MSPLSINIWCKRVSSQHHHKERKGNIWIGKEPLITIFCVARLTWSWPMLTSELTWSFQNSAQAEDDIEDSIRRSNKNGEGIERRQIRKTIMRKKKRRKDEQKQHLKYLFGNPKKCLNNCWVSNVHAPMWETFTRAHSSEKLKKRYIHTLHRDWNSCQSHSSNCLTTSQLTGPRHYKGLRQQKRIYKDYNEEPESRRRNRKNKKNMKHLIKQEIQRK